MSPMSSIFLYVEKHEHHELRQLFLVASSHLLPKCVLVCTYRLHQAHVYDDPLGSYMINCCKCSVSGYDHSCSNETQRQVLQGHGTAFPNKGKHLS